MPSYTNRSPATVNGIVSSVEDLLRQPDGQQKITTLTRHFARIVEHTREIRAQVIRVRPRPGIAFYVDVGRARPSLDMDVRYAGQSCGRIRLRSRNDRFFFPSSKHRDLWGADTPRSLEWRDRRVRIYLDRAASRIAGEYREAEAESALLVELAKRDGRRKQPLLLGHQPVRIAGLPFQFPLPLRVRGSLRLAKGNAAGHVDVLARTRRGLRVIEVKKPGVKDADHALSQAVAYAATLRYLLQLAPSRHVYFRLLGYSTPRNSLPMEAVALVHESARKQATEEAKRLGSENDHFGLCLMFYKRGDRKDEPRILITDCVTP